MTSQQNADTRKNIPFLVLALILCAGAALLLFLSADTSPTTPETRRLFGLWRLPHAVLVVGMFSLAIGAFCLSRRREAFFGFLSVSCTFLLVVGALEASGRLGLVSWSSLLKPAQSDEESVGWVPVPNQHSTGETYQDIATRYGIDNDPISFDVQTDKYGFRNSTDDIGDIILLGDSIVFGGQVAKPKTIDAVLADKLGVSVSQVALLGLSIQEQHELLLESGIDLSGKTVVQLLFEGNDLLDSRRTRAPATSGGRQGPSSLIKSLWGFAVNATDPTSPWQSAEYCTIGEQRTLFLWTRRSFDGLMGELPHMQEAIEGFAAQVRDFGGNYLLVFVPTKYRVMNDACSFPDGSVLRDATLHLSPLPQALGAWSVAKGISYLDLTAALKQAARAGARPWLWGDTHWGDAGHRVSGQAIGQWDALIEAIQ